MENYLLKCEETRYFLAYKDLYNISSEWYYFDKGKNETKLHVYNENEYGCFHINHMEIEEPFLAPRVDFYNLIVSVTRNMGSKDRSKPFTLRTDGYSIGDENYTFPELRLKKEIPEDLSKFITLRKSLPKTKTITLFWENVRNGFKGVKTKMDYRLFARRRFANDPGRSKAIPVSNLSVNKNQIISKHKLSRSSPRCYKNEVEGGAEHFIRNVKCLNPEGVRIDDLKIYEGYFVSLFLFGKCLLGTFTHKKTDNNALKIRMKFYKNKLCYVNFFDKGHYLFIPYSEIVRS